MGGVKTICQEYLNCMQFGQSFCLYLAVCSAGHALVKKLGTRCIVFYSGAILCCGICGDCWWYCPS